MKFKELAERTTGNENLYIKVLDGSGDAVLNQFKRFSQYYKFVKEHSDFEVISLFTAYDGLFVTLNSPE